MHTCVCVCVCMLACVNTHSSSSSSMVAGASMVYSQLRCLVWSRGGWRMEDGGEGVQTGCDVLRTRTKGWQSAMCVCDGHASMQPTDGYESTQRHMNTQTHRHTDTQTQGHSSAVLFRFPPLSLAGLVAPFPSQGQLSPNTVKTHASAVGRVASASATASAAAPPDLEARPSPRES